MLYTFQQAKLQKKQYGGVYFWYTASHLNVESTKTRSSRVTFQQRLTFESGPVLSRQ